MTLLNNIFLTAMKPLIRSLEKTRKEPAETQAEVFRFLLRNGTETAFGHEHGFSGCSGYDDFRRRVPVRNYDQMSPYIERIRKGEDFVLWNQKTRWFARSSGTSSDKSKYIPVTPRNLGHCHFRGFKTMLVSYICTHPDSKLFTGKSITLGGSVRLDELNTEGAVNGDLSAILLQNSPSLAELVRTPPKKIALLSDFEEKIGRICEICSHQNVTNFSGVPSWNLLMINRLLEYNKVRHLNEIWPNIELFMHGGISFDPYREQYRNLIPAAGMHYLENYNASEGYFALQDDLNEKDMLLTLDNDVFYEFIPMKSLKEVLEGTSDDICPIEGVRKGVQYALVISTSSGLWRYLIGDCVEFTSLSPCKIIISGRTRLYINAFGEELMIHNAEEALMQICSEMNVSVSEYTVAPIFMDGNHSRGAHQWCIEFSEDSGTRTEDPQFLKEFEEALDLAICRRNSDYEAKRKNNTTMNRLSITAVPTGTFYRWMETRNKIGGQNKVPRLSNSRRFIEEITALVRKQQGPLPADNR